MRQATSLMLGTASTLAQVAGFAEESVQDMENVEYGELFLTELHPKDRHAQPVWSILRSRSNDLTNASPSSPFP